MRKSRFVSFSQETSISNTEECCLCVFSCLDVWPILQAWHLERFHEKTVIRNQSWLKQTTPNLYLLIYSSSTNWIVSCSGSLGVLESIPEVTSRQEYTLDRSAVQSSTAHTPLTPVGVRGLPGTGRTRQPNHSQHLWQPNGWMTPALPDNLFQPSHYCTFLIKTLSVREDLTHFLMCASFINICHL